MDGYPNLYADLGVEMWLHPITKDFAVKFLRSAKEYGVLDRVMFGSDQMVWPEAITSSINFLNALQFLTKAEKEMTFYKNAKKFLALKIKTKDHNIIQGKHSPVLKNASIFKNWFY